MPRIEYNERGFLVRQLLDGNNDVITEMVRISVRPNFDNILDVSLKHTDEFGDSHSITPVDGSSMDWDIPNNLIGPIGAITQNGAQLILPLNGNGPLREVVFTLSAVVTSTAAETNLALDLYVIQNTSPAPTLGSFRKNPEKFGGALTPRRIYNAIIPIRLSH